jgi:membrane-bound serine protease (ClpP class)
MAPSTNIGAAHPVSSFGGDIEGTMGDKVVSDTAAWARSLAETRGRNSEAAEKAVKESASFTVHEALARGLVDLGVDDLDALLAALDGRRVAIGGKDRVLSTKGARIETFEKTRQQAFYDWLANPTLLYLLLLAGILGVYLEVQSPGMIIPGVLGAACLGIVFGLGVLPVNTFGALLIGLSAILFFAEIYVTSFGILAGAGLACLIVGSYLLFEVEGSSYRLAGSVIWSVAITFAAILLFFAFLMVKARRQGPTSGIEALVGKEATASEALVPDQVGRIFMDGAYWNARSDAQVEDGARVLVRRIDGLTVFVRPTHPSGDSTNV